MINFILINLTVLYYLQNINVKLKSEITNYLQFKKSFDDSERCLQSCQTANTDWPRPQDNGCSPLHWSPLTDFLISWNLTEEELATYFAGFKASHCLIHCQKALRNEMVTEGGFS